LVIAAKMYRSAGAVATGRSTNEALALALALALAWRSA
jgi:hypothetical protein